VVESLQSYIVNLLPMSSRTGTYEQSGWVAGWTVYYWIWWISWVPFVGMFVARISKGRTVRELIVGVTLVPTAVGGVWFAVFGGLGTYLDLNGSADIAGAVEKDPATALFAVFDTLPFAPVLTSVAMVLIALYFISGVDAATVVLGILSTGGSDKPPKWVVVFWGAAIAAAASVLMLAGGLDAIQATMAVVCAPFAFIMVALAWSLLKKMREDLPVPPQEALLSAPLWNGEAGPLETHESPTSR
jgi:choline-glycine betaine transporter